MLFVLKMTPTSKKVCAITGSSSGIGAASAELFAQRGWDICINYSRHRERAEAVARICRAHGAEVVVECADVSDNAQCLAMAAQVEQRFGRCDALVNNAGTTKFVDIKDLDGLSAEDFQHVFAINVIGAYQMTRAFAPMLKRQPGAGVIMVSSVASLLAAGSSTAYIVSKGALNTLTQVLARALGPQVRVNAVAPGMVNSTWLQQGLGPERFAMAKQSYETAAALASLVMPHDVAEMIFWLAAGALKTTGEIQVVDAGRRIGR
ncbi:MAG TPA: SDR family oxidoreductase [Steroidobacteraceae bacterium]